MKEEEGSEEDEGREGGDEGEPGKAGVLAKNVSIKALLLQRKQDASLVGDGGPIPVAGRWRR